MLYPGIPSIAGQMAFSFITNATWRQIFGAEAKKSREKWKTVFGVHHVRTLFVTMDKMNQPYKIAVGVETLGDSGFLQFLRLKLK